MPWFKAYPYFAESLVLLAAALLFVRLRPRGTRLLGLCGGIVAAPFALLAAVHFPGFWEPVLIFGGRIGIEDFLWCGAAGTTVWCFALLAITHLPEWHCDWRAMVGRAAIVGGLGAVLHWPELALVPSPAGRMPATLVSMTGVAAVLVWFGTRIALRQIALPACAYAIYHWIDVWCFFRFWPESRAYWNPDAQLPFAIAGVPAYEVFWAVLFGATWPIIMTFVTSLRVSDCNLDEAGPDEAGGGQPQSRAQEEP
jgi:hypothetical protein